MIKFHKLLVPALAASLMGLVSVQAQAAFALPPPSTYYFSGQCLDCAGVVTARLVLKNYILGTALSGADNFVSFTYNGSNLLPAYSVLAADSPGVSGNLPLGLGSGSGLGFGLPVAADFHLTTSVHFFDLSTSGIWNTGSPSPGDNGNLGSFSPNAPSSVPEPATMLLMGAALAAAGVARRLRKS